MPEYADSRYMWDAEDLEQNPALTPAQFRAYARAGDGLLDESTDGESLSTLRNGELDWAFFSHEVINYWNQFQHGIPFEGPGLVKLEYSPKDLNPEYKGMDNQELEDKRWDFRTVISPELLIVRSSDVSETEEDIDKDLQHLYGEEWKEVEKVADAPEAAEDEEDEVGAGEHEAGAGGIGGVGALGSSSVVLPERFASPVTAFRYQKDLDAVTFDTKLSKMEAGAMLMYLYQKDQQERKREDDVKGANATNASMAEWDWINKYKHTEFGDHFAGEEHPDTVVLDYFHDAIETMPEHVIERHFGAKNQIFNPREFVQQAFDKFEQDIPVSPLQRLTKTVDRVEDVPKVMTAMLEGVQADSVPEDRRAQFARFKQMLYRWTQYTELRSQQHGANEQKLLSHREQLMDEFRRIKGGEVVDRPETEHLVCLCVCVSVCMYVFYRFDFVCILLDFHLYCLRACLRHT